MADASPPIAIPPPTTAAWVEVDVSALIHNAGVLRRAIPAATELGLLVKANGYGHGLVIAARAAVAGGADRLIVATLDEALALRAAGIDAPLLVVYPILPDAVDVAVGGRIELSISGTDAARRTLRAWGTARERLPGARLDLHVEVDSGMGRGGVATEDLVDVVGAIDAEPATRVAGIWSHLADGRDPRRTEAQVRRYEASLAALAATGRPLPPRHVVASEALGAATAPAYDAVRIGLAYYGELGLDLEPAPTRAALLQELRPAMTVKARAIRVERVAAGSTIGYGGEWVAARPSVIATLPIGYADGWPRASWPGAEALVAGRRVALVGRVSMDSVCADVTDIDGVAAGDEFVLLGGQGRERITANELARRRGTIPNEVLCSFGPRLPRRPIREGVAEG